MAEPKNETVQRTIDKLHDTVLSVILSTINEDGTLETSYSPYVFKDGHYYILTSDLAPHSNNMKNNPNISFLIIEDEANTTNMHARLRLSYRATVERVDRESKEFNQAIAALKERTGRTVDLLVSIADFNLYKITPTQGRLVLGFGKAYLINHQTNVITHVDKDYIAKQKEIAH